MGVRPVLGHLRAWAFCSLLVTSPIVAQRLGGAGSENFKILFFGDRYEFLVPHVGASMRNSLEFHRELYGWEPHEKPIVFLQDFSDSGTGAANSVPNDYVIMGISPFYFTYETLSAIDRFFWLANHEVAKQ